MFIDAYCPCLLLRMLTFWTQGYDRALEQSLDAIKAKAGWLHRDGDDVKRWLSDNGYLSKNQKL